ncbi:MAG: PilZ domain-containing protein [Candidatus Omnitrophica bacterium]|nr:PilZ domain-containing protein [Candidatus Omnitrophota bacterium]MCB9722165.1 PilZ domain-containing protein [Candidatus Omnitrophota bacterium]
MVKKAKTGIERRQYVRAKRVLSVEFKLKQTRRKAADKSTYLSTTEDMSIGGISFYSDQNYAAGDVLDIHVVMSGVLDIFHGPAKVVRCEPRKPGALYLVAVKFIKPAKRQRRTAAPTRKTTKKRI